MEELDEFGIPIKKQTSKVTLDEFGIPIKKKDALQPTSTPQKSVSGTPTGSSGGVNPAFKNTAPSPIPDFNSVWKEKKSVEKPKTFRLPNEADDAEMQRRGIAPPPSEMLKQTANNTKELYDLDANGNVIPEKKNKLFSNLKPIDKTKGFYQQGDEFTSKKKDTENGFSEKTTFELDGGKLIPKTTVKDFKTSEGIDKEIENNDLNLDHPYLYYSTFDKENQPKDTFVESNFGENKLADLGINIADFDGFLNKKGYKAEFLDKEANGLFEGKGSDLTGGYNIQLAKEIQKQRLLNLYMQDINSRDFAKRKLNQEKVNLSKLGADREQLNTQYTLFDSNKVGAFYEKEMPILTQKLKERDAENLKIYEQHKKGDAGFFYGTKQVLNSGWNGFLDRVNQTSSTMLDKIGLDSGADELRLLNEERQIQRPNTRDVGYASGRTTTYDGVKYLVTNDGQIIDQDKKIRVTDLFFKPTYDAIVNKSRSGEEDSVFSFQGSAIQAGGVLGDMIVQVALQRGVGLASGATVKAGSLLSKIPISKSIGSAIIAQSALGYSQGLEQTYKAAIDAGIDEKTAKVLAADAAQRMAGLYAVTAPISPQTKAIEGIFGSEGKELIKKAIAAYTQTGKKGFIETFKQGGKQLSKNAIIFTEEGGKEVFQENIQQGGENYGVNASINRDAGRELLKETISGDEFVNTSILSFGSGGLMTLPGMFSSTDKLKTLQQLSKDPLAFEKNLKELVAKGVFTNDKADVLRKDVKIYSNQSHKIPKNLNKDIAMDVMSDLEDISQLEVKKKGIDKSFHEEIDAEIEAKRTGIRDRINFVGLSKKEIATLKETASDELIAEAKEQGEKEFKFDNKQITERANKIYAKQVKENKKKENEQTPPTTEAQPQAEAPIDNREKRKFNEAIDKLQSGEYGLDVAPGEKTAMIKKGAFNNIVEIELTKEEQKEIERQFRFNADGDLSNEELRQWRKDFEKRVAERYKSQNQNPQAEVPQQAEAEKVATPKPQEVSPVEDVVATSVENDFSKKSIDDLEKRQAEIEGNKTHSKEFNEIDKELEKREWQSVMLSPLSDVNSVLDNLVEKNKYMPNGFGSYIEKSDIRESKKIVEKYEGEVSKEEAEKDFKDAFFGNPSSWYADGLKLKESVRSFTEQGGTFKELLQSVQKEFESDGFTEQDAANVINRKLAEITKVNETTPKTNTPTNGNVPIGVEPMGESGNTEQESPIQESVSSSVDGGEVKGDASVVNYANNWVEKTNAELESKGYKGNIKLAPKTEYNGFKVGEIVENKHNDDISHIKGFVEEDGDIRAITTNDKYVHISNLKKADGVARLVFSKFAEIDGDTKKRNELLLNLSEKQKQEINDNYVTLINEGNIKETPKNSDVTNDYSEKPIETPRPKSKGDVEVSDLDHAKSQIDKGVLLWNGDSGAERVNLGIPWADIRKGEADINKGKIETTPAKKLIEALKTAKEKGGYEYIQGRGGVVNKQFVSLSDIQRSTNEYDLTDLEQKEVDADEYESARKYDEDFNSLTENEQTELLENYENSQDNSGTPSADSGQLQSESDVSKEKEGGTGKKPTTKERISERIKISDAKVDDIKAHIKGIDNIFGIKIKIDDVEGLNKNGIDFVEVIASIAKQAIAAGIHIDEAINKTIEHFKGKYDFDVNIDEIKERINPKKEAEPQKPESKSNDSRREKSSSEKASDLGLTEKQYLDLGDKIKDVPETGVFKKYLSGETIQREYGDPTNDQSYDVVTLKDIAQHGEDMLIQAKELFGEDYVAKTLDYLQVANLNSFEKGIVYAALENLMDTNVKSDPKNKSILKQQALVYADSQANLRVGSVGINIGKLRSVYNAIKNGIDIDKLAGMVYTDKQKEAKTIIEGAVPNGENLNRASDINENSIVDSDLEKLISDGVDKQINEIYKKLPSNRKAKADKAISALENIQKRLRTKTYDASIGLPIAILDAGITVIKNSIKAGVNISDAIEIGINHIKEKYGKKWDKEDDFRKDMHDGFGTEGIDSKERSPKQKSKANGVKETVKQALIDAGFYREIKGKNGVNKVLDWVKLVGRDASVEGLKKNVEEQLKKQGFDDAKIAEISKELELEYKRLAKDILDKATADLERRNLIKPSPNRKSDNQRLVDLYNEGLFGDNIKKYENVVNRILGFSDIDNKNYKEIKQKLFALAELYKAENDGKRVSEQSINAVSNDLNHAISNLMSISAFKEAPTKFKIASLAFEYGVLAQKALLGGIKTLAENVISGDFAVMGNKATTGKYMTPELQKQSKANVKAVKNDIVENAGLYYGDTTTSLVTHSIIEDIVNQKIKSKTGHVIMSAITLRRWLDAKDSAIKVRLTDAIFVKNAVTILTSKTNPNGAMTEENAIQFVSEALTGDNFDKALVSAKAIIDDVNSKQEIKQLKDNPEAIHRFAMELVRENLMSGNKMTMAQIEDSFNAAYKSAGRSIGHEANNPISRQVNMGNAFISEQLNKAVSNKEWSKATALMVQSLVMRAVVQPFAGGGANWTVIGAEKGVPVIGYISTAFNYAHRTPLELNSVIGIKNTKESLYRENNFKESAVRNVIGTGFAVLAYMTMVAYKDDDDENYAKKFNDWMNKPENQWVRPYFNKLVPTSFSFVVAMEDEELGRYLSQLFGVGGENFNDTLKVIKSIDNTKEGTTSGAIGKLVGKPFSSPFAWKAVKDARDVYRGLAGLEPIKYSYKTNGFMNGYLQGGLLEQLGLRPDLKIDHDSQEQIFLKEQEKKRLLYKLPENEKVKIRVDRKLTRVESDVKLLQNLQTAQKKGLPYFISMDAALTKQQVKDMDLSGTDESVARIKQIVSEVKAQYGIEDEE